jgi:Zn-dependent peptidase ImmA (M78 family)
MNPNILKDIETILLKHKVPVNIEEQIRSEGIILNKSYLDFEKGICGELKKENGKFIINISWADHYYRKRFTMAHELGHFVLHKDLIGDGVDDNKEYKKLYRANNKITNSQEVEANDYAAKVLMPEEAIIALAKLTEIIKLVKGEIDIDLLWLDYLSKKFQVSKEAFTIRLAKLSNKILPT